MHWLVEVGDPIARVGLGVAAYTSWAIVEPSCLPTFRPMAFALSAAFAADGVRGLLRVLVFEPAHAAHRIPFVGWERVAFHVDAALLLGFYALSLGAALVVFLGRRARCVAILWLCACIGQVALYPALRGQDLVDTYLVVHVGTAAVELSVAFLFFWRRGISGPAQRVALLLLGADISALFGPWWAGDPGRDWYIGRWPAAVVWMVVCGYQWRVLWISARTRAGWSLPIRSRSPRSSLHLP